MPHHAGSTINIPSNSHLFGSGAAGAGGAANSVSHLSWILALTHIVTCAREREKKSPRVWGQVYRTRCTNCTNGHWPLNYIANSSGTHVVRQTAWCTTHRRPTPLTRGHHPMAPTYTSADAGTIHIGPPPVVVRRDLVAPHAYTSNGYTARPVSQQGNTCRRLPPIRCAPETN